jgi:hypothetical protein
MIFHRGTGMPAEATMRDQVLNQIQRCLAGQISLHKFELWLAGQLQDILDTGDPLLTELVNEAEADFIQLDEGILDEAEVRRRLRTYAHRIRPMGKTERFTAHIGQPIKPSGTFVILRIDYGIGMVMPVDNLKRHTRHLVFRHP